MFPIGCTDRHEVQNNFTGENWFKHDIQTKRKKKERGKKEKREREERKKGKSEKRRLFYCNHQNQKILF